jgi:hypothetical protein
MADTDKTPNESVWISLQRIIDDVTKNPANKNVMLRLDPNFIEDTTIAQPIQPSPQPVKKGRPRKTVVAQPSSQPVKRGRPRKVKDDSHLEQ